MKSFHIPKVLFLLKRKGVRRIYKHVIFQNLVLKNTFKNFKNYSNYGLMSKYYDPHSLLCSSTQNTDKL